MSASIVRKLGFPSERITDVLNSVDTQSLKERLKQTSEEELALLRERLGLDSNNVAVYTGALRSPKRIDFLLEAADVIRSLVPDFNLIILGDGEHREKVVNSSATRPWIHWEGAKHEAEKVPYWALSKLLLMPGGVGLVVLDSFALGVPMVTTENRFHGPEIDYLKDGVNGIMVKPGDDASHYATEVVKLLRDDIRREALAAAARADSDLYSSEDMCQRFTQGVLAALEAPRYRVLF